MLRDARESLELSQAELSGAIEKVSDGKAKVAQSTWSSWERGRQLPSENDKDLPFAAQVLHLNLAALLSALREQQSELMESRPPASEVLDNYLDQVEEYLEYVGNKRDLNLWIFGTAAVRAALPGEAGRPFRDFWARNVAEGLTFRYIWFLDQVEEDALYRMAASLYDVADRIGKAAANSGAPPAKTVHYAVLLGQEPIPPELDPHYKRVQDNLKIYQKLQDNEPKYTKCLPPKSLPWPVLRDLQLYWTTLGSVILYAPTVLSKLPAAHLVLRDMRLSLREKSAPQGEYRPNILWLPDQQVQALRNAVERFDAAYHDSKAQELPVGEWLKLSQPGNAALKSTKRV